MAGIKFLKTSALAALAAALTITAAVPAQARQADGEDDSGRARWSGRSGEAHDDSKARGGWSRQAPSAAIAPAPARSSRGGQERGGEAVRGSERERGPGYGRDWNDGGSVSRPTSASGGAAPAIPERGRDWSRDRSPEVRGERTTADSLGAERSRTYSAPRRSRSVTTERRDDERRETRDGWRDGYRDGGSRWTGGDYRRWDSRDWRRDNRYNWSHYRGSHRDQYRVGRYYSPYRHYSYSRLSIGVYLDRGFYRQNYWIDDPWSYRLPEVYGPYRWVRYYDDVLLVDIYNGEVVDVIYDFFW